MYDVMPFERRGLQVMDPRPYYRPRIGFIDPVTVTSLFSTVGSSIANLFGKGRREADIIAPVQDQVMQVATKIANQVGLSAGGCGTIPASVSTTDLQRSYDAIVALGREFLGFLRDPHFTDGRASRQAANAVMPSIDGTGYYKDFAAKGKPLTGSEATQFGFSWVPKYCYPGGITGAIERALGERRAAGGAAPAPTAVPGTGFVIGPLPEAGTLPPAEAAPWWAAPSGYDAGGGAPAAAGGALPGTLPGAGTLPFTAAGVAPTAEQLKGSLPLLLVAGVAAWALWGK